MYVVVNQSKGKKKIYQSVLLRESRREGGKVKNRTIANLSHCKPNEIEAIRLALKHKDDPSFFQKASPEVDLEEGQSIGAAFAVYTVARRLGVEKALGVDRHGKLALWQVMARVLSQGSRLSAVRLAQVHAAGDVLRLSRGFDENDLYDNLGWLCRHQDRIENRLFAARRGEAKPELFLYDVTSSYLEGEHNQLAEYGYNRDKKRGKKQIVIGLLCDEAGEPVSVQVFQGNTSDLETVESQIKKAADRFGCRRVTFVGDRGMIKSGQIEDLQKVGFHYITAITKPQIRALIKQNVLQLGLFDEKLCEVEQDGVRYILRKNPVRAEEIAKNRISKLSAVEALAAKRNEYLAAHPRADAHKAYLTVWEKADRLMVSDMVAVRVADRRIIVEVDDDYLKEMAELDGCYAIRTELPKEVADAKTVHDRYKDLALVERAFRTMKTGHLEVRPIYVRTAASTRGHVLVVMLAYLIVRELSRVWAGFDMTVEEGINCLSTLCFINMKCKENGAEIRQIPRPREESVRLLKAADVNLPKALPKRDIRVVTRQKLSSGR